ncbi:MAG: hypothetical protein WC412_01840 [Candidatus Omnitrophota bacterium]|jgi:hypothetical protein
MNKKILRRKFKKTIKSFIKDEDGFVNKNKILKIGLGTIGSLGILSSLSTAYAGTITTSPCSSIAHANFNTHQNGINCSTVGSCQRCSFHNNAAGAHINHSAASSLQVHGKGTLSGKGSASLNIHCG